MTSRYPLIGGRLEARAVNGGRWRHRGLATPGNRSRGDVLFAWQPIDRSVAHYSCDEFAKGAFQLITRDTVWPICRRHTFNGRRGVLLSMKIPLNSKFQLFYELVVMMFLTWKIPKLWLVCWIPSHLWLGGRRLEKLPPPTKLKVELQFFIPSSTGRSDYGRLAFPSVNIMVHTFWPKFHHAGWWSTPIGWIGQKWNILCNEYP